MDRAWAYGTAIVNINTGKNFTIEDVKTMKREYLLNLVGTSKGGQSGGNGIEGGAKALEIIIGVNDSTINTYVQCLYLEPETQKMIGKDKEKIPHTYARVVTRLYPDHKEKQKEIEQLIRDGAFKKRSELRLVKIS